MEIKADLTPTDLTIKVDLIIRTPSITRTHSKIKAASIARVELSISVATKGSIIKVHLIREGSTTKVDSITKAGSIATIRVDSTAKTHSTIRVASTVAHNVHIYFILDSFHLPNPNSQFAFKQQMMDPFTWTTIPTYTPDQQIPLPSQSQLLPQEQMINLQNLYEMSNYLQVQEVTLVTPIRARPMSQN